MSGCFSAHILLTPCTLRAYLGEQCRRSPPSPQSPYRSRISGERSGRSNRFLDVLAIGWLSGCRIRAADWKRLTLRARCLFKLSEKVPDGGRTKGMRPG